MNTELPSAAHATGFIAIMARHKVAANILMLLMILSGLWGLANLNRQFLPTFTLDAVLVIVVWPGSTAQDVDVGIAQPIELALKELENVKKLSIVSRPGSAETTIEVTEGADPQRVVEDVSRILSQLNTLPGDARDPVVRRAQNYERMGRFVLTTEGTAAELWSTARRLERELLNFGIDKITTGGLPREEIRIEVPIERLAGLQLSLPQIADTINSLSRNVSAGRFGRDDGARELRSAAQRRDPLEFASLKLISADGRNLRLGDIADISRRPAENQPSMRHEGKLAVEFNLQRLPDNDLLEQAGLLQDWIARKTSDGSLPDGFRITLYNERWKLLQQRIDLLLKNAAGGLALVVLMLILFLNRRLTTWVAVGIPVSFLATFFFMAGTGKTINMISLFGLIMALGIVVDDAVVVGENMFSRLERGADATSAAIASAHHMLPPIIASSLTTVAAFLPLLLVGGIIGQILRDIPMVVICVILASLVECFLVLPGHLSHSLADYGPKARLAGLRARLDRGFDRMRNHHFRRLSHWCFEYRGFTLSTTFAILLISFALVAGGKLKFIFFPSIESDAILASVEYSAGTRPETTKKYLARLEQALLQAEKNLVDENGVLVKTVIVSEGRSFSIGRSSAVNVGDQFGGIFVGMQTGERPFSNRDLIREWKRLAAEDSEPGLQSLLISALQGGPPGEAIEFNIRGADIDNLKAAAEEFKALLRDYDGVYNIRDTLPYGNEEYLFQLSPLARSLNFSVADLGRQLRSAFEGIEVQTFHEQNSDIQVRLQLPEHQRNLISTLERLPVRRGPVAIPLGDLVDFRIGRGLDRIERIDGAPTVIVKAQVDNKVANANEIIARLRAEAVPGLIRKYGFDYSFGGSRENQRETLGDMRTGVLIGIALIYLILAWVFSSYTRPFIIMTAIPFGIAGGIYGHFIMNIDLTVLSMFGFFGLAGIVINNSIVLLTFYDDLRARGMAPLDAAVEAACQRLRAVMVTSLTTIGGLTPIMFETSRQAQFLIPMAVSLVFGLALGAFLILLVVPSLMVMSENLGASLRTFISEGPRSGPLARFIGEPDQLERA